MQTGLLVTLVVISFALIVLIYMQSGWARNVSSSIIGTHNVDLFENSKTRGSERILLILTGICVFLFILFAILIRVI